ncbi:sigma-70 family RNA polymerase sigma factor [Microbacterium sp. NPDC096154]|uniref:sigma-70 family RNA polymerase sigma factor n=1 Tax=Microbacterium sp. NPDC096154 TaxID=3155549 RepID=UPI003322F2DD
MHQPTERPPSDADLVLRSRSGDTEAFGELWARHYAAGARVARAVTSAIDPDDLVQEAYTRVFQAVQRGGGPSGPFRAYLFTVIRNTAASWGRARRETAIDELEAVPDPATTDEAGQEAFDRSLTHRAFLSLPTRWQEVLWYTEVEGLSPAETAPLLGVKAGAVKQLAFRAREGLREAWIQAHISSLTAERDAADCHWAVAHVGAHARGNLAVRNRTRLEAHLRGCDRCALAAAEAEEAGSRLALALLPPLIGVTAASAHLATLHGAQSPIATVAAMPSRVLEGAVVAASEGGPSTLPAAAPLPTASMPAAAVPAASIPASMPAVVHATGVGAATPLAAGVGSAGLSAVGLLGLGVASAGVAGALLVAAIMPGPTVALPASSTAAEAATPADAARAPTSTAAARPTASDAARSSSTAPVETADSAAHASPPAPTANALTGSTARPSSAPVSAPHASTPSVAPNPAGTPDSTASAPGASRPGASAPTGSAPTESAPTESAPTESAPTESAPDASVPGASRPSAPARPTPPRAETPTPPGPPPQAENPGGNSQDGGAEAPPEGGQTGTAPDGGLRVQLDIAGIGVGVSIGGPGGLLGLDVDLGSSSG